MHANKAADVAAPWRAHLRNIPGARRPRAAVSSRSPTETLSRRDVSGSGLARGAVVVGKARVGRGGLPRVQGWLLGPRWLLQTPSPERPRGLPAPALGTGVRTLCPLFAEACGAPPPHGETGFSGDAERAPGVERGQAGGAAQAARRKRGPRSGEARPPGLAWPRLEQVV